MIVFPKQHWLISVFFFLSYSPLRRSHVSALRSRQPQPLRHNQANHRRIHMVWYTFISVYLSRQFSLSLFLLLLRSESFVFYIFFGIDLLCGWFEHDKFHSVKAAMPCGDEIDVYKHKACLFFICRLLGLWCFSCVLWTNRIGGSGMDIRSKARVSRYSVYPSSVFLLCFLYGWSVFVLVYTDTPRTSDRSIKASQVELRRIKHRSGRWRWQWSHSIVCSSIISK